MSRCKASSSLPALLPHESINACGNGDGKSTIVLIHGAFSSRSSWDMVTAHLQRDYHILIPDLPGHGVAKDFSKRSASRDEAGAGQEIFSVRSAAAHIATLIAHKAQNSVAHVVGFSLGAHVALRIATQHAACVATLLLSGFEVFPRSNALVAACAPYAFWSMQRAEALVPRKWIKRAMDGADLPAVDADSCTLELCRAIAAPMTGENERDKHTLEMGQSGSVQANAQTTGGQGSSSEGSEKNLAAAAWPTAGWPAPTLVITAGKSSFLLPTADHPHDARRLAEIGRSSSPGEGNPHTRAVTHPDMRHPWCRQDPELFAETVRAWIERGAVLEERGFIAL